MAADVDGDGDPDLYVTNYGRDRLWTNRGDGSFEAAPAPALDGWGSSAAFADADGDGDLDLYVTRYLEYPPDHGLFCGDPVSGIRRHCDPSLFVGSPDALLENRQDGSWPELTDRAGIEARGRGLGVLFTDLDGDGAPDLYVANDLTLNLLFAGRGDGTFEDLSLLSGTAVNADGKPEAGMGLAVGDVDGDGDADLAVTNFDVETNTLYENLGAHLFAEVAASSGFGVPSFNFLAFGLVLDDLDLDGDLDVYIGNGHIFEQPRRENVTHEQRDQILLGDGRGRFVELRSADLDARRAVSRGVAVADFDNDGDGDLGVQANGGRFSLLENEASGRWVGVSLRGQPPNTEAVGARVTLTTESGDQVRWVTAGDSYQSSSDRRVRFGVADGVEVRALEVLWPSGLRQKLAPPPFGRYLVLPEPSAEPNSR